MKTIGTRLARIEDKVQDRHIGDCPVCHGQLFLLGIGRCRPDGNGGYKRVIEWQRNEQATPQLKCRGCGGEPWKKMVFASAPGCEEIDNELFPPSPDLLAITPYEDVEA